MYASKIFSLRSHFLRKAQRDAPKALAHWFNQKRALARGQNDPRKAGDVLATHRVTDYREDFLTDLEARDH